MVKEIDEIAMASTNGQVEYEEHSRFSKAKKVIDGSLFFVADGARTAIPQNLKTTPLTGANKSFRVISDVDFYFNLSQGAAVAATTADIYVPAKTPITIATRNFDYINVSGTGFIQASEVK